MIGQDKSETNTKIIHQPRNSKSNYQENSQSRHRGYYYSKKRTYIPTTLRKKIIQEWHELLAHGYQGIKKTLERVSRYYYFPGIRKVVKDVVTGCDTCIRNKSAQHSLYRQLKLLLIPDKPWKSISMDFIVKLPKSKEDQTKREYDSILIVVYRLTKYTYIILYKEASTAEDLAQVLLKTVFIHYRVPDEIISDRDKLFISKFWTILSVLLGSKRKLSTVFYSQTDR